MKKNVEKFCMIEEKSSGLSPNFIGMNRATCVKSKER